MASLLAEDNLEAFPGGVFLLDAAMNGVGLAPPHESDLDMSVWQKTAEVSAQLIAGEIETGVNLITGDLLEDEEASG